jgi:hypothetical protein
MQRRLDTVDRVEFKTPCSVPWATMHGDDRVRRCDACRKNVYNIEALTRPEARRLIADGEGRICIRIFRRSDGTVATADCWARLRAARQRGVIAWLVMLVVVGWTGLVAARFGLDRLRDVVGLMTKMAAPAPVQIDSAPPAPARQAARPVPADKWGDFAGGI